MLLQQCRHFHFSFLPLLAATFRLFRLLILFPRFFLCVSFLQYQSSFTHRDHQSSNVLLKWCCAKKKYLKKCQDQCEIHDLRLKEIRMTLTCQIQLEIWGYFQLDFPWETFLLVEMIQIQNKMVKNLPWKSWKEQVFDHISNCLDLNVKQLLESFLKTRGINPVIISAQAQSVRYIQLQTDMKRSTRW